MKTKYGILISLAALVMTTHSASADEAAKSGRAILAKCQDAVITVRLAIKQSMSMGGRDSKSESKIETTGTMIDSSGLTVVSLTTTDPGNAMKEAYARAMAARGGDPSQLKFDSEVSDVKILLADGTEIAADVVLRDKDLDLAYLRPSDKPAKPLPFVDLARDAKPQVLDEVVVVNRLNKAANRAPAVSVGRIEAMVEKPRTFYVLGEATWGYSLGAPVFSLDGKLIGILLLRSAKAQVDQTSGFMYSSLNQWGMMPIVLPAADIVDGAKQALEAKMPVSEEKPAPEKQPAVIEKPTTPPQTK
jgi:hypothetical protein